MQNGKKPVPQPGIAQFNAMKALQAKNEMMAKLFGEALDSQLFPQEKLSERWKQMAPLAMMQTNPLMHRLSLKDYAKAMGCINQCGSIEKLSLFQFGVLNNAIEAVSPNDLHLSSQEYVEFIGEVTSHIEYYTEVVTKLKEQIDLAVENDATIKDAVIKAGGGVLKPITGQA